LVCGFSKLPLKLFSENHFFPASTIAPDDISGTRHSVAFGSIIAETDGNV